MKSMYSGEKLMNSLLGASEATLMVGGPGFPLFSLPERRRAPRLGALPQPPAPRGCLGLLSLAPGLSSPAPASSAFPARRRLRRLRRREASEWRIPHSQNALRSQNAARSPPPPFPSGESGLASSPRRLGNVGSSTIVPAPEERADDGAQVPPEIPTFRPARGEGNSRFQAPHTRDGLDPRAEI